MCSAESIPPSRRWRTIIRLPTSAAKTAIDQAFQTTFGVLPSDPAAANISASAMQSFLSGPFAALFPGASWSADWSSASSDEHER